MDPQKCRVYTQKGTQCSRAHKANSEYCSLHETKRDEAGPHTYAREQLAIKQKFERANQFKNFHERRVAAESPRHVREITNEETIAEAHMTVRHRTEIQAQRDAQELEIVQNDGRDPDAPARMRRELKELEVQSIRVAHWITRHWARPADRNHFLPELDVIRTRVREIGQRPNITQRNMALVQDVDRSITERMDEFMARAMQDEDNGGVIRGWGGEVAAVPARFVRGVQVPRGGIEGRIVNGIIVPPEMRLGARAMALPAVQQLAQIANDNQNVHTSVVVEQTKKNVVEILKIPVPDLFKWRANKLSMTYKSIIMFCHLSPKSTWQFSSMYCSDATIYEMEPGIFGKVVDGVWQYIRKSPDKEDLKKILAAELRDNVGMCAQGNLSRMCNVLQGYLDGIGQKESVNTILGREFQKLMEIEDQVEREARGVAVLRMNDVPEDQWETWLEPLRS